MSKGTSKHWRLSYNAPVILTFVALCFVATLLNYMTGGKSNTLLFMTYHSSLLNPLTYLRFFTHVIGHASWSHFFGNILYLLLLGPILEEKYGSVRILEIMVLTAVVTGLINYIFFPQYALCGASGVVFALILLISFTGFEERTIPLTFLLVAVIWGGQQIYQAIAVQDNISNMAHIVGGIIGAVFGFVLHRTTKPSKRS